MMDVPVIAIDGPSGSGKGTIARRVAEALGFHLLDSGALYRLTALAAEDAAIDPADPIALAHAARELDVAFGGGTGGNGSVWLNGEEVSARLRTEECGRLASRILARDIADRDRRDTERSVAPLVPADDAVVIDSTSMDIDEVTREVLGLAAERLADIGAG
ncbi:MAG: (d)CMP kinase [Gammaproteobacteria bacterium]